MSSPRQSRLILSLLILAGVYPLMTGLSYLTVAVVGDWAIWQRTMIMSPIIVLSVVFAIIPVIQKLLARK